MKHHQVVIPLFASLLLASASTDSAKTIMVHYMPWYASKAVSGSWGWHWTMNRFDPDKVLANGQREIASHDYPLIGPYDSSDPHALECQALLMKFAGIDGVIIDWYGIQGYNDYAAIHRNTLRFIEYVKKAGLSFAICYEDQTLKHMIRGGALTEGQSVTHGKAVFEWMQANWFVDGGYQRVAGRPLLLVFGPQYFDANQWQELFAGLPTRPYFYALNSRQLCADGAFGWPPMQGKTDVTPSMWRKYLSDLYARDEDGKSVIGAVFPKFYDIYEEAGLHDSYGYLDDRDGKTFDETFRTALESPSQLIQIVTWNDYGEGTAIEPTTAFGFRYLEKIQEYKRAQQGKAFLYQPEELRLPVTLYQLRKALETDPEAQDNLDSIAALLFTSECQAAREKLQGVENRE